MVSFFWHVLSVYREIPLFVPVVTGVHCECLRYNPQMSSLYASQTTINAHIKSDNLQYNRLVLWDKWLADQASGVPSIILFIISYRLRHGLLHRWTNIFILPRIPWGEAFNPNNTTQSHSIFVNFKKIPF